MSFTWQDLIDKVNELDPDFLVRPAHVLDDSTGEFLEIRDMAFPEDDDAVPFLMTE